MSWTDRADLAEAAAAILANEGRFDGSTPPLTATDAVDLEDVAAVLSELSGRPVRRVVIDDQDFVSGRIQHGMPSRSRVCSSAPTWHLVAANSRSPTTTLGTLLGQRTPADPRRSSRAPRPSKRERIDVALDRIDSLSNVATHLERRVNQYFQSNVHIANGGMLTPRLLSHALDFTSIDGILLSGDYPFHRLDTPTITDFVGTLTDREDQQKIAHANAEALYGLEQPQPDQTIN